MGNATWNDSVYTDYSKSIAGKSQEDIFTNRSGCHDDLNPAKFGVRESCDSPANPQSTPVIIGVDETGSMGMLATTIIKKSLGIIIQGIYDRKPVTDPHVLLAAIGDATCDDAPIQTTQFEADIRLAQQIEKFFIEGNGGGNGGESYPILWWFAAHKTKCDAIIKRNRMGYLFTVGDESPLPVLTREEIQRFMAGTVEADVAIEDLLDEVSCDWNVFHLITPTSATRQQNAIAKWRELLGERAIEVSDHNRLGEVIVSIMQVNEGQNAENVAASWDGSTGVVVRQAISGLSKRTACGGITVVDV
ncbi:MAG: hypothetical protein ABFE13_18805 [Phycisphaerales bacterium]